MNINDQIFTLVKEKSVNPLFGKYLYTLCVYRYLLLLLGIYYKYSYLYKHAVDITII